MLTYEKADVLTAFTPWKSAHWFRLHMPYAFIQMDDKGLIWLPVNRAYKPLGTLNQITHVKYENYLDRCIKFSTDPRKFKGVWDDMNEVGLYLYGDDPDSRRDYFERFEKLMSYACKAVTPRDIESMKEKAA